MLSFSEVWSVKGRGRVVLVVSEASEDVSELSVSVLSEPLLQLAASRDASISRQKIRKLRGDALFIGIYLSSAVGCLWGVRVFSAKRFECLFSENLLSKAKTC